jgi:hypothetical protein
MIRKPPETSKNQPRQFLAGFWISLLIEKNFPAAQTVEFMLSNVAYRATAWSTLKSGDLIP